MECANEGSMVGSAAESRRCLPYTRGYAGQRSFVPGRGRPRPGGGPCYPRSMRIRVEADRRVTTFTRRWGVPSLPWQLISTRRSSPASIWPSIIPPHCWPGSVTSVFEKEAWLAERGLDLPWPAAGLARAVNVDSTGELHAAAFTQALEDFGVALIFRPHRPTAFWRAREAPDQ